MKHNNSNRRSRGRGNGRGRGGNNRAQVFDSNGPDVRIRGTAHQICEKYEALAKDARSSGDAILAESYLQHAEHYQRIILSWIDHEISAQEKQERYNDKEHDDLSLPDSILGGEVKVEGTAKKEGVHKKELEDA